MTYSRKFLLLKDTSSHSETDTLLLPPYKNILKNLEDLSTNIDSNIGVIDEVREMYDGIRSLSGDPSLYHTLAFLQVTSYYQASKGGRGKFLEKKIASFNKHTGIDFDVKSLPVILKEPILYRKNKLFNNLTPIQKQSLRSAHLGFPTKANNKTLDMYNISSNKLTFLELKNRVDSGGDGARQEFFSKFRHMLNLLINKTPLYSISTSTKTLNQLLRQHGINAIQFHGGLLFNIDGTPASMNNDPFMASNRREFDSLIQNVLANASVSNLNSDQRKIALTCEIDGFNIQVSCLYGNNVIKEITKKKSGSLITQLLEESYSDLAIAQQLAISEREMLLRTKGENNILNLRNVISSSTKLENLFKSYRAKPDDNNLEKIISELKQTHGTFFSKVENLRGKNFMRSMENTDEYVKTLIQIETVFFKSMD
jgi:hypothetical protein